MHFRVIHDRMFGRYRLSKVLIDLVTRSKASTMKYDHICKRNPE